MALQFDMPWYRPDLISPVTACRDRRDVLSYKESYIGQLRAIVGDRRLIVVTPRAVIRDNAGGVLFVRRNDNAQWVMPSGSMELDETVFECLAREVKEEAGLSVHSATPMAIYTFLNNTTSYGDPFEQVSIQFMVTAWSGSLERETNETTDARFFPIDQPPDEVADPYHEILADLRSYDENGVFLLKESRTS